MEITRSAEHRWQFRTPSLRNVALTAPYMHTGTLATLDDVIEFYNRGGDEPDTHAGTTTVTVPCGQFCASALLQKPAAASANKRMPPRKNEATPLRNA